MESMSFTLVAEQASIRRERCLCAVLLCTLVRFQVRVKVLAVLALGFDDVKNGGGTYS